MSEVLFDLRRNGVIMMLKAALVAALFLGVHTVIAFSFDTDEALDQHFSASADTNMYGILDSLAEGDAFAEFRESPQKLTQLADFYHELNSNSTLKHLSVFNQSLPVRNFTGGPTFEHGYGTELATAGAYYDEVLGGTATPATSVQLNRSAYEFYQLDVAAGQSIDFSTVDYSSGTIPVVLGSDYAGVYDIGDTLTASLYFQKFDLRVVGILERSAAVYFDGDINHYLSNAIVVPYPDRIPAITPENQYFCGILSFAMLGGTLAAPQDTSAEEVLNLLGQISDRTGFHDYAVQNLPQYLVSFTAVRSLITSNADLLVMIEVLTGIGVAVLAIAANVTMLARRRAVTGYAVTLGTPRQLIRVMHSRMWAVELAGTVLLLVVGTAVTPGATPYALGLTAALLAVWVAVDLGVQHRLLTRMLSQLTTRMSGHDHGVAEPMSSREDTRHADA